MKNAVAAARKTKTAQAAKLDWWEAGYYTKGSKVRARRTAKRELARAVRRAARAAIQEQV